MTEQLNTTLLKTTHLLGSAILHGKCDLLRITEKFLPK